MIIPSPPKRPLVMTDVECYKNYFLCGFKEKGKLGRRFRFERYEYNGQVIINFDRAELERVLSLVTIGTFNGKSYDVYIIIAAMIGYSCEQLKWLSDAIIQNNMKPWEVERSFNISVPPYIDHIDIFDVAPGSGSLKAYGAKMHSKRIQDLPLEPSTLIESHHLPPMIQYNDNDNDTSEDLFDTFEAQLELREELSKECGVDLRSKSDAQIAEAYIKAKIPFYVEKPVWAVGTSFQYTPPAFINFRTPVLQQFFETVKQTRFILGQNAVELPIELDHEKTPSANIRIGGSVYRIGIGGLHSSESCVYHLMDAYNIISDHDVRGYYPSLMLLLKLYPKQLGPIFLEILQAIVDDRNVAKEAGNKKRADSLKIVGNGAFGKLLSKFGILSAPYAGIHVTVTGQLALLMLIERMELAGIPVISANTDGIVLKCPRHLIPTRDAIIKQWQVDTGLFMEDTEYLGLFSRDVNSYIAIKTDRKAKLKGEFAPPIPVASSWPNPTGEVCVDAIVKFLTEGIPVEHTIRACTDIKKFVYARAAKGGCSWIDKPEIKPATTQKGMREQLAAAGWVETAEKSKLFLAPEHWLETPQVPLAIGAACDIAVEALNRERNIQREYLGRVARWYYATGSEGLIVYNGSGNLVAETPGSRPAMTLPDTLPTDVDYDWYAREAKKMMGSFGLAVA